MNIKKPSKILKFHYNDGVIKFHNFINQMGFWMTMGSGKTIVIIKLIEILNSAMSAGILPKKDIMFFWQMKSF
ncbi:MAG: hypothetical protein MR902_00810 [Campylobacter sp.]|nr:hypothetical protein [Campylobacter sp.]